jgi:trehalose 6-phosphate synthase
MRIGAFPVGIDAAEFRNMAEEGARHPEIIALARQPERLVVGVDRLDYTKGLTLKFDAFSLALKARPELLGGVTLLQVTPKSRSAIPEYTAMEQELDLVSGRINADFGDLLWTPIRFVTRAYPRETLAGLFRIAEIGLVTPLRDGMNLVAKEFVAAQDPADPGVLVLSEFAGAAAELRAALLVNPNDSESVAAAIRRALDMTLEERISRHGELLAAVERTDIGHWGERFITTLVNGGPGDLHPRALAAE